jgi:serine/threonine protein kinase
MWKCIECGFDENEQGTETCSRCQAIRDPSTYVGEQIGQWRLEKPLGEGGMAVVYLARHVMLGSKVAIKLLRSDLNNKRDVIERFRTEALAASHLRHENVIQVLDFGFQKGIGFYMVLEFLEGNDLETHMVEAPMSSEFVFGVTKQIAEGLQAAHSAGIIHRDLKPSNIFLVPRPNQTIPLVKILDFGIAKIQEAEFLEDNQQNLTKTGTVLGTPFYISPEQLTRRPGVELGASVDIYALGVIVYQMITGKLPIEEPSIAEQMVAILTRMPPKIGTLRQEYAGSALEIFLQRALAKTPTSRASSVKEFWEELEKALGVLQDSSQNEALRQAWEQSYKPFLESEKPAGGFLYRWRFALIAAVILLIGAGSWIGAWLLREPPQVKVIVKKEEKRGIPLFKDLAFKDFEEGRYQKALDGLRKIMADKQWRRDQKGYDPSIYRVMAQALSQAAKEKNHATGYAELQFLRLYLKENSDISNDERQQVAGNINALQKRVNRHRSLLNNMLSLAQPALKANNKETALKAFSGLFQPDAQGRWLYAPDRSDRQAYEKTAAAFRSKMPGLSLALLRKAAAIQLPPAEQKALKASLQEQEELTQQRLQRALASLANAISKRSAREAKATLQKTLDDYGDLPQLYPRLFKMLEETYLIEPRFGAPLFQHYYLEAKRLFFSSLKPHYDTLLGNKKPSVDALEATAYAAKLGVRGVESYNQGRALLNKGDQKAAARAWKTLPARLKRAHDTPKSLLREAFARLLKASQSASEIGQRTEALWKESQALAKEGRLNEAQARNKAILDLLKGTPSESTFQQRIAEQDQAFTKRCERFSKDAQNALARLNLTPAKRLFQKAADCWKMRQQTAPPNDTARFKAPLDTTALWLNQLAAAPPLLDKLRRHMNAVQNNAAQRNYRDLNNLLKESPPATKKLQEEFSKWGDQRIRFERLRELGIQAYNKEDWSSAYTSFKQALALFPQAHNKEDLNNAILECQCNIGASWIPKEKCNELKKKKKNW